MRAPLPLTPAQRIPPPALVARVCMNGHLADDAVAFESAGRAATNRADPLDVMTTDVRCATCGAGTIVGCAGCGYPIPGRPGARAYAVPHFCIVCGEYYPWTFRGEFYETLAEIVEEARLDHSIVERSLRTLDRQREGLATDDDVRELVETFRSLGGSDWDLAAQILTVVLPPARRQRLDLRGAFAH